ncbi:acyltransferase family protein [Plantibacter sp. Mn2098]|uniref:acyltransferase family protein n=1 Tax=Plantibacter sp. Mn2098 TaxID=3395266 RepID=UPI003BD0C00E
MGAVRTEDRRTAETSGRPRTAGSAFRPEIQALRALAITLVVVYHLMPARLHGGYVGVDVFFVISGYLITSHLLGEVARTGTISLTKFWARRIRRLLPASLLVLAVTLVATLVWMPDSLIQESLRQIGASAVYIVNWALAADSVDYLAANNLPTAVQHFWSLSVEEQFYVVWPVLLVVAVLIAKLARRANSPRLRWLTARTAILSMLILIFVVSFGYSVAETSHAQQLAYFSTFARAWEFGAGAIVGLVMSSRSFERARLGRSGGTRAISITLTWIGLAAIVFAAVTFTDASPFPGSIAMIPVVGTALVILFGGVSGRGSIMPIARLAPVQRIGDWSYAIYLWHWPMIVILPRITNHPITFVDAVLIGVVSILLGALTKVLIEDPVRKSQWWGRRRWPSFAFAAGGAAILIIACTLVSTGIDARKAAAAEAFAEKLAAATSEQGEASCFGANAMAPGADCPSRFDRPGDLDLAFAASDLDLGCIAQPTVDWKVCERGDPKATKGTLALVGDSHAQAMLPAVEDSLGKAGWKIVTYFRVGCPALSTEPIPMPKRELWEQNACATWSARVLSEIESRHDISTVLFSGYSSRYNDPAIPADGRLSPETVAATWNRLEASGKQVIFIRDIPDANRVNIPACIGESKDATAPCAFSRATSVVPDEIDKALVLDPAASMVDLTDFFCDDEKCYGLVGGVVTYADENHVSGTFAKTLAPFLGERLARVLHPAAAASAG